MLIQQIKCPHCGYPCDSHSMLFEKDPAPPREGDLTFCIGCANPSEWIAGPKLLLTLRAMKDDELGPKMRGQLERFRKERRRLAQKHMTPRIKALWRNI